MASDGDGEGPSPPAAAAAVDAPQAARIEVVVRVRPENAMELATAGHRNIIEVQDDLIFVSPDGGRVARAAAPGERRRRTQQYLFDKVYGPAATQNDVFDGSVRHLIPHLFNGYNASMFCYGATGAGKTFTMMGDETSVPGVIPMSVAEVFRLRKDALQTRKVRVSLSYSEIYNEQIRDLLAETQRPLEFRETGSGDGLVAGLTWWEAEGAEEVLRLVHVGNSRRVKAETNANEASSRSHAILQLLVETLPAGADVQTTTQTGKLSLIDLAGSERAAATVNRGLRLKEGANINKSLLALGNVINSLASQRARPRTRGAYVGYRDSKLTRMLKDSLGGNCKTLMMANISPSYLTYEDTTNALKYATRAKSIKVSLTRNTATISAHISQYKSIITTLQQQVAMLQAELRVAKEDTMAARAATMRASTASLVVDATMANEDGDVDMSGAADAPVAAVGVCTRCGTAGDSFASVGDAAGGDDAAGVAVPSARAVALERVFTAAADRQLALTTKIAAHEANRNETLLKLKKQHSEYLRWKHTTAQGTEGGQEPVRIVTLKTDIVMLQSQVVVADCELEQHKQELQAALREMGGLKQELSLLPAADQRHLERVVREGQARVDKVQSEGWLGYHKHREMHWEQRYSELDQAWGDCFGRLADAVARGATGEELLPILEYGRMWKSLGDIVDSSTAEDLLLEEVEVAVDHNGTASRRSASSSGGGAAAAVSSAFAHNRGDIAARGSTPPPDATGAPTSATTATAAARCLSVSALSSRCDSTSPRLPLDRGSVRRAATVARPSVGGSSINFLQAPRRTTAAVSTASNSPTTGGAGGGAGGAASRRRGGASQSAGNSSNNSNSNGTAAAGAGGAHAQQQQHRAAGLLAARRGQRQAGRAAAKHHTGTAGGGAAGTTAAVVSPALFAAGAGGGDETATTAPPPSLESCGFMKPTASTAARLRRSGDSDTAADATATAASSAADPHPHHPLPSHHGGLSGSYMRPTASAAAKLRGAAAAPDDADDAAASAAGAPAAAVPTTTTTTVDVKGTAGFLKPTASAAAKLRHGRHVDPHNTTTGAGGVPAAAAASPTAGAAMPPPPLPVGAAGLAAAAAAAVPTPTAAPDAAGGAEGAATPTPAPSHRSGRMPSSSADRFMRPTASATAKLRSATQEAAAVHSTRASHHADMNTSFGSSAGGGAGSEVSEERTGHGRHLQQPPAGLSGATPTSTTTTASSGTSSFMRPTLSAARRARRGEALAQQRSATADDSAEGRGACGHGAAAATAAAHDGDAATVAHVEPAANVVNSSSTSASGFMRPTASAAAKVRRGYAGANASCNSSAASASHTAPASPLRSKTGSGGGGHANSGARSCTPASSSQASSPRSEGRRSPGSASATGAARGVASPTRGGGDPAALETGASGMRGYASVPGANTNAHAHAAVGEVDEAGTPPATEPRRVTLEERRRQRKIEQREAGAGGERSPPVAFGSSTARVPSASPPPAVVAAIGSAIGGGTASRSPSAGVSQPRASCSPFRNTVLAVGATLRSPLKEAPMNAGQYNRAVEEIGTGRKRNLSNPSDAHAARKRGRLSEEYANL